LAGSTAAAVLHADPLEVEEFFEVPLAFLMDGANHQRRLVIQGEHRRTVYAMEYVGRHRYLIWGATAAMLRNFYRFMVAGTAGLRRGRSRRPDEPPTICAMSWIALILTLLLEQVRATPSGNPVYTGAAAWADKVAHNLNAGKPRHGGYGWLLVVGVGVFGTALVFELARSWSWLAGLAVDVLVLFLRSGFASSATRSP
jgi:hypothetical protein